MNREDIIRMAREVGLPAFEYPALISAVDWQRVERFAALVAAAERKALAEQPARQEPVAWIDICEKGQMSGLRYWSEPDNRHEVPLYTSPPAQQQEPVACKALCELCVKRGYHFCANAAQTTPIPSPPASKPWVGLTDEEILACDPQEECWGLFDAARAIETKLKEKNHG